MVGISQLMKTGDDFLKMFGRGIRRHSRVNSVLLVCGLLLVAACGDDDGGGPADVDGPASTLPDLSGMAWLGGNDFLGVHDAKNPDELDRPRVSVVTLATDPAGTSFRTVDLDWPDTFGPSSDLESLAAIPGTREFLMAESGDDGDPDFRRIFRAVWDGTRITLRDFTFWPVDIFNVEAIAVAAVGDGYVFAFAERAEGMASTLIRWASFEPESLTFGVFSSVAFDNPDPGRTNRPIVGMDFDSDGNMYVASAFDPDVDNGPFLSSVYLVGRLRLREGAVEFVLDEVPELLARVDGLKIESVVVRDIGGEIDIIIGTDDENLGNVVRPLP